MRHQLSGPLAPAPPPGGSSEETGMREFLGFVLGTESYALPLSNVREIMRVPRITEVPRGPRDVLGIISVRGQVTTLIDLRRRLSMPEKALNRRARVLLVEHGSEILGLLVDSVLHVYRLQEDEVEMTQSLGSDTSSYVMGIGRPGLSRIPREAAGEPSRRERNRRQERCSEELLVLLDPMALLKPYGSG